MTPQQLDVLKQLAVRPLTWIDLKTSANLKLIQSLERLGYVRDYGKQVGRRTEVRLRIWGITGAGKAILESREMVDAVTRQPALPLNLKKGLKPGKPVPLLRTKGLFFKGCVRDTPTTLAPKK